MWHCQSLKRQLTVQEAQTLTKTSNSCNFSDKHRTVKKGHRERNRSKLKMIVRWLMAQHARASPDSVEGIHLYQGAVSVRLLDASPAPHSDWLINENKWWPSAEDQHNGLYSMKAGKRARAKEKYNQSETVVHLYKKSDNCKHQLSEIRDSGWWVLGEKKKKKRGETPNVGIQKLQDSRGRQHRWKSKQGHGPGSEEKSENPGFRCKRGEGGMYQPSTGWTGHCSNCRHNPSPEGYWVPVYLICTYTMLLSFCNVWSGLLEHLTWQVLTIPVTISWGKLRAITSPIGLILLEESSKQILSRLWEQQHKTYQ